MTGVVDVMGITSERSGQERPGQEKKRDAGDPHSGHQKTRRARRRRGETAVRAKRLIERARRRMVMTDIAIEHGSPRQI